MISDPKETARRVFGPVDEALLVDLAKIDASEDELWEARAWLTDDESLVNAGRPMPGGKVRTVIELVQSADLAGDED